MPAFAFVLVAVAIGLATGVLFGTQSSVNGYLGQRLAHPLQASLISFAVGTVILFFLTVASGTFPPEFRGSPLRMPWWAWTGGAIGVLVVSTSLYFVPRVGSLVWFATIITGQMTAALTLDHFGLLGNPRIAASPLRVLGLLLLMAGVFVIVLAQRGEAGPRIESVAVESGQNVVE